MTPHKHAAVIKAWADGAPVQCRIPIHESVLTNWVEVPPVFCWREDLEYRVKPQVVKYRRSISKRDETYFVSVFNEGGAFRPEDWERVSSFIRWIDTEWQEVEV